MPVSYEHTFRIVKFHQISISVMKDLKNAECCICNFSYLTHRKCFCDRLYTSLDRCSFQKHGSQNLRSKRRKNIGFHTTSHPICKNNNIRIFRLKHFHLVAAQLFMMLIQAFPRYINTYTHTTLPLQTELNPEAWTMSLSSLLSSPREVLRSPVPPSSACQ